jgi:hypothetical protein
MKVKRKSFLKQLVVKTAKKIKEKIVTEIWRKIKTKIFFFLLWFLNFRNTNVGIKSKNERIIAAKISKKL